MQDDVRPSPLALTVLGLLIAGPLHPYAMQRLIRQWGKDEVINVGQRASLYRTIKRLHQAGLVAILQTERDENYPERTVYELTESGRQAVQDWLLAMLRTPRNEFPEFPAALSFAMLLAPEQLLLALEQRAASLRESLANLTAALGGQDQQVPRLFLLETEYVGAVTAAELTWVEGIVADLRTNELNWTREELQALAESFADYQQVMGAEPPHP
jgi:DNA-binding PadR family transcriptional regulator